MKELVKKIQALKTAKEIGCSGAHKMPDGNWMPCASHEELERISNLAETSKWRTVVPGAAKTLRTMGRRRKKKKDWEELGENSIRGIESLDGGGLVSGNFFTGKAPRGTCWEGYMQVGMKKGRNGNMVPNCVPVSGKAARGTCWEGYMQVGMKKGRNGNMVPNCVPVSGKAAIGPEYVRDNDVDVFIDAESARARARQIGCIGISKRISKSGRAVWMPCTNMSDYANRSGSTALGRRNINKTNDEKIRKIVRTVLRGKDKATIKRKVSIFEQLRTK